MMQECWGLAWKRAVQARQAALAKLTQKFEDIVVASISYALEYFVSFGLRARLKVAHELADFSPLCLQNLVAPSKGGPPTLSLLGLVSALRAERLAA